ncbi:hypothetical protein HAX54_007286 [Datura stramonium]|uniref:Uncharacterized protein n=1 Tax=Datura stramonium TaxID=4076 RepID=A0ABS8TE36_DATST|nr:hypothetical protein [Datura stramonium]
MKRLVMRSLFLKDPDQRLAEDSASSGSKSPLRMCSNEEILSLKDELAESSEETIAIGQIAMLKANLEKKMRDCDEAIGDLDLVDKERRLIATKKDEQAVAEEDFSQRLEKLRGIVYEQKGVVKHTNAFVEPLS